MSMYKINILKTYTKISLGIFLFMFILAPETLTAQIDRNIFKQIKRDSIHHIDIDSLKRIKNTRKFDIDTLQKSTLKDKLFHEAQDYMEINEKKKFIKLYNKAHIKYQDIDLKAGVIYVDYAKEEVYAGRIRDSLGNLTQRPVFKQGKTETENDSIRFNFKTKKALVWNTYTQEGEFALISELTKKYNDSVMFVKNVKFTTSTDKEHPEYYFLAKKGKIVPGKKIVIGTTQMWVEDVATPLVIPFGFFPLTDTRRSGLLMPTFADTRYGYSLNNGGFYWAASPYFDMSFTGDVYTNGSYGLQIQSRYFKRYRFNGDLSYRFNNQITSERGLPGYEKNTDWKIKWTHHQDNKSNPLSNFSANVDFGSSDYYRTSTNYNDVTNTNNRMKNIINSSVNYTKKSANLPINYSLSLTHNQNTNTKQINLTLPTFNLNVSRLYPFARHGSKKNIWQKINLTYKLESQNKIQTTDSLLFSSKMWEGSKMGVSHTIPITTNAKIFKYFNFSPKLNFKEVWAFQSVEKHWDPDANNGLGAEVIEEKRGFQSFRDISMGASLSTAIYGTYLFGKNKKIQGIRHTINMGLSYSYNPIFDKFIKEYYNPQLDKNIQYTIFDNGLYGKPRMMDSKNLSLSFSNNFEAKIKTRDDKNKKIRFLSINSSYNFLRDSLKLSNFNLISTAKIIKGLNVNMNASFDPYALDENGIKIDKLALSDGQGIGRIQTFSLSTGYKFSNDTFKSKEETKQSENTENKNKTYTQKFKDAKNTIRQKKMESADAYANTISWTMNLDYNFGYNNPNYQPDNLSFKKIPRHSLTFDGSVSFSPSWQISYRSGYDFVYKDFTLTQFTFMRDLKSWQMLFTWEPIGNKAWYFKINIKSTALQGIKYDKRREPFRKFF